MNHNFEASAGTQDCTLFQLKWPGEKKKLARYSELQLKGCLASQINHLFGVCLLLTLGSST